MRILFFCDRNWKDTKALEMTITGLFVMYYPDIKLMHCASNRAEKKMGKIASKYLGPENVEVFPSDYNKYGDAAQEVNIYALLENLSPDMIMTFGLEIMQTDIISEFLTRKIPVYNMIEVEV